MVDDAHHEDELDAGDFSAWLAALQVALRGEGVSDVPCGTCTACCTSSQFVHIAPDETEALAAIPAALRFPAPGLPLGHVLLGYDERGHCPMLIEGACSIYEHRPRTCRTYDCRVFPAAGVDADDGDPDKVLIAQRARRWRFTFADGAGRARHEAVRAAAAFLREHPEALPAGDPPPNPTALAVLAVEVHRAFVGRDEANGHPMAVHPDLEEVRVEINRLR